jgi:hypothetical protein
MVIRPDLTDFVVAVQARLPPDFDLELTARASRALTRVRQVKSAAALLRLALGFGACGMSLRETCAWAEANGLGRLANPSLIERLCKAAAWLGTIVAALIARQAEVPVGRWQGYRLRALDGTSICEPGADRTTWRLHVGYDLATGQVDQITLTDGRGAENLQRLIYRKGDIVLGDRYYARPRDLRPVIAAGADFIVRTGWNSLRLRNPDGTSFDLFAVLEAQVAPEGEAQVRLDDGAPGSGPLMLRLVIRRKSPEQAETEVARLLKEAKKRGRTPDPRSLQAAHYILLLTALPQDAFPATDVLALYRFRWQLELAFKRMKSLAGLDALVAKKPKLAQAWIYARLIAFLIAEQNAGQLPDSPPCDARTAGRPAATHRKPVALAPHQNGTRQLPQCHSWATDLANPLRCFRPLQASPL